MRKIAFLIFAVILSNAYFAQKINAQNNNAIVPDFDNEKDSSLQIRLSKINEIEGCLIVYISGYLDTYNSAIFKRRISKAIDSKYKRLIFHLGNVDNITNNASKTFVEFNKAVKLTNGNIVLVSLRPNVYESLRLTGLTRYIMIMENTDEAIAYFKSEINK